MRPNRSVRLEICVDTAAALSACEGLADRIELCSGLAVGGLTPDPGLLHAAADTSLETHVLIRPKTGDFIYTKQCLMASVRSIVEARALGLKGVVIGAERDGKLDRPALEEMIAAADGMNVTLHRVIDVLTDPVAAVQVAADLGIKRILTSGAAKSAVEGIAMLNQLHAASAGRVEIMAGGGINSHVLPQLIDQTPLSSFHASCSQVIDLDGRYAELGFGGVNRSIDWAELKRLSDICRAA